ncbi:MAG: hypothetical protein WCK67_10245 [bacterium]
MSVISMELVNVSHLMSITKQSKTQPTSQMKRKPDLCYSLETIYDRIAEKAEK